jgi:serine/threonine protein kinase
MFSFESQCWKIGDFHLTTIGGGEISIPSSDRAGTPSYPAPELLDEETGHFSNKVDIFAMGCILFELLKQEKAFSDDFAVFKATSLQQYPDLGRKPSFVASEATYIASCIHNPNSDGSLSFCYS